MRAVLGQFHWSIVMCSVMSVVRCDETSGKSIDGLKPVDKNSHVKSQGLWFGKYSSLLNILKPVNRDGERFTINNIFFVYYDGRRRTAGTRPPVLEETGSIGLLNAQHWAPLLLQENFDLIK